MEETKLDKYPIDIKGNMMEIANPNVHAWASAAPFYAKMTFSHIEEGRSSLRFILKDENGKLFSLMRVSINSFMKRSVLGKLPAQYKVVKRGLYYGLMLMEDV